jgi:enediyne polyketide synthase
VTRERIAIVGIGLRYPDAGSPEELWENVLAGRRAFRRLPDERMNQADYYSADPHAPDRFYSKKAAVLRDYSFDRMKYKISGSTFRSTDLAHWLALEVAHEALADAGFAQGEGLPKLSTGVVLGNTLTGEFSRANVMRLRWPYVRRTVASALAAKGWSQEETSDFLRDLEPQYKAAFPPIDADTLAGGLANTIAGRICNYFDLGGGGYTVDGACSSSLLSIANAAKALVDGDMDVCLAGGVDLSIDPFEVIGFAKTGALAKGEMKVYDKDSNGFWPGEGSGIVVLMREEDAIAQGRRIYASITGWGISSDGKGGLTRPEEAGHRAALARAYGRAGYGVETVSYFEGHGTGTAVGDATELEALSGARRLADPNARPAALGTIKGNIGHTKAAAGIAGLIKITLAVHHGIVPPGTGQYDPHPTLAAEDANLVVLKKAALFPEDVPARAGVSSMGFGGINSHIAVEQAPGRTRRTELTRRVETLVASRQDAELFLFDGATADELRESVARIATLVTKVSYAELTDVAGALAAKLTGGAYRAAVIATNQEEAERKLNRVLTELDAGNTSLFVPADGVFLEHGTDRPRIAFLFPGQGSGRGAVGAIRNRFLAAENVFRSARLPVGGDQVATEVAQPRIVAGSLAGLGVLNQLGVNADVAVGHSLGELTALTWAGALGEAQLLALAKTRGRVMAKASTVAGAMAGFNADGELTASLIEGHDVVIAGLNGPDQTVIAGPVDAVDRAIAAAKAEGVKASRINVSHAFHSPLVKAAADAMGERLAEVDFDRPERTVVSTVSGDVLDPSTDLRALLKEQIVKPVRFHEAAAKAVDGADLVLEVGPGRVLSGLVSTISPQSRVLAIDTDSASLTSLLGAVAAAFTLGASVDATALFTDRVVRPISLDGDFTFLESPCEAAPDIDASLAAVDGLAAAQASAADGSTSDGSGLSTLDLLRKLAAERVELPLEAVTPDTHPLDDLHLSSITVGQIINDVTRELGRPALSATTNFATVTIGELATLIDDLDETAHGGDGAKEVPGIAPWVRPFSVDYVPARAPRVTKGSGSNGVWTLFATEAHLLAELVKVALAEAGIGDGVLLVLPESGEEHVELFLEAGKAAIEAGSRFVVVQQELGASGLSRTLHLEHPNIPVTVIELPDVTPAKATDVEDAVRRVVAEVAATTGYSEVRFLADGTRTVPVLNVLPDVEVEPGATPLSTEDVLVVTGGGKGITAECALAMAQDSGAALGLIGRADPASDPELAANLARMTAAGVRFRYERADVTSAEAIASAITAIESEFGAVTAVLHGAGRNEPTALVSLGVEQFQQTLAPKVDGLRAVLNAIDQDKVKLLITFGSIIGRAGLRGEAHYSTANDWMTELTVNFQREHPNARAVALEWSVWSGAGMGEKLGVVEALEREGITAISLENGIGVLRRVLADPQAGPIIMVSGRTGGAPTLTLPAPELPLVRFLDRVLVHYPGVELITEAELSAGNDPYLADHLFDENLLFPAVIGMEAMTQVAYALTGREGAPTLENLEFLRPIVVRPGQTVTVRLAAQVKDSTSVSVVIRAEDTGYSADHFRVTLRLPRPSLEDSGPDRDYNAIPAVPTDPTSELYGSVMFQGKRFQQLVAYRTAAARHAVADLATQSSHQWFAAYLPQELRLANPGTRDAVMHSIQCCVPDATLLPQGVERLYLAEPASLGEYVIMDARERFQDGDSYTYDIDVRTETGELVEQWRGLTLRAVSKKDGKGPWVPTMLTGYLERALEAELGGSRTVVVEPDPATGGDRRAQTDLAVSRALGRPTEVRHRPDGKPEIDGASVSVSHGAGVTLAIVGQGRLGCDVETVLERDRQTWDDLIGAQQVPVRDLLVAESGESEAVAGTRVWSALECLRKTGATSQALTVERVGMNGWVVLSAGDAKIATWVTTLNDLPEPVVFAVLVGEEK